MKFLRLWRRRFMAIIWQSTAHRSKCWRCWRGYKYVRFHTTPYHACDLFEETAGIGQHRHPFSGALKIGGHNECAGVCALCEDCWSETTVVQRKPYYEHLMAIWRDNKADESEIAKVMRAVERGL